MQKREPASLICKTLYWIMLLALFVSAFGVDSSFPVQAKAGSVVEINAHILSDGQFVYGPNIGSFDLKTYLQDNAPHLVKYADDLYGRSEYFSINPKIYLTLLEIHGELLTRPDSAKVVNPLGLSDMDFISQIEYISGIMSDAYYLHLYSFTSMSVAQRKLPPFVSRSGDIVSLASEVNAGTYAVIAALAKIESQQSIARILDNGQSNGFYQTYIKLFGNDNPLDETNHLFIPGELEMLSTLNNSQYIGPVGGVGGLVAPIELLQLPFLGGLAWKFGGVHDTSGGGGVGTPFNDASSLDFYPSGSTWGMDTSNMWVVAAASGIPTRYSDCGFKVSHSGALNTGWETTYYHLEGAKYLSGSINQNDKIGVIANTLAEATCTGGAASGPHVHFSLKYNGAYVAINGTPLSGWYVHSGRWNYDTDPNYMWLERAGQKKYPYGDLVLSEAPPIPLTISGNAGVNGATLSYTDGTPKSVMADGSGNYSFNVPRGWSGTVTPSKTCYDFSPASNSYSNVLANQTAQNFLATPVTYTFCDVPDSSWAWQYIERLYNAGITSGCSVNPKLYCPAATVTRDQMAIFLLRGKYGSGYTPPPASGVFQDVPVGYWAGDWIEQLAAEGITSGCSVSPKLYCPTAAVTRDQMAIFLLRAKHGSSYVPPPATGVFQDVPVNYWAVAWIEQLAAKGITSGCSVSPKLYCPTATVTRDQMAVFLVRNFNLP